MLLDDLKAATTPIHHRLHEIVDLKRLQQSRQDCVFALMGYWQCLLPLEAVAADAWQRCVESPSLINASPTIQPDFSDSRVFDDNFSVLDRLQKARWLAQDLKYWNVDNTTLVQTFQRPSFQRAAERIQHSTLYSPHPNHPKDALQNDVSESFANALPVCQRPSKLSDPVPPVRPEDWPFSDSVTEEPQPARDFLIASLYVTEGMMLGITRVAPLLKKAHGLTATTGGRFFHGYGSPEDTQHRWQQFRNWANSPAGNSDSVVSMALLAFHWFETLLSRWLKRTPSLQHA